MPRTRLRETLKELEWELERTGELDAESREQLERVVSEAREVLEQTGPEESGSLLERLREATREFEKDHPALSETIGRLATALSNLGI